MVGRSRLQAADPQAHILWGRPIVWRKRKDANATIRGGQTILELRRTRPPVRVHRAVEGRGGRGDVSGSSGGDLRDTTRSAWNHHEIVRIDLVAGGHRVTTTTHADEESERRGVIHFPARAGVIDADRTQHGPTVTVGNAIGIVPRCNRLARGIEAEAETGVLAGGRRVSLKVFRFDPVGPEVGFETSLILPG